VQGAGDEEPIGVVLQSLGNRPSEAKDPLDEDLPRRWNWDDFARDRSPRLSLLVAVANGGSNPSLAIRAQLSSFWSW
jgi:hypothetical protein